MIRYSDEDRNAYILSLAELRCRLAAMNGPDIQWEVLCLRVVEEAGEPRTYVVIRHLDVDNAPNEPHFLFPAASAGGDIQDERQTLVLLDPSMATPQNEGR